VDAVADVVVIVVAAVAVGAHGFAEAVALAADSYSKFTECSTPSSACYSRS
jgi:hypothetical protein